MAIDSPSLGFKGIDRGYFTSGRNSIEEALHLSSHHSTDYWIGRILISINIIYQSRLLQDLLKSGEHGALDYFAFNSHIYTFHGTSDNAQKGKNKMK